MFPFIYIFLNYFQLYFELFTVQAIRLCSCLLFTSLTKNFILFDAIKIRIVSFSNCSLLLYRDAANCCKLILYPINLMMIKDNNLAQFGTIKDRNGMDLTEAEDIKKRWQEHRRTVQKRSS